MTREEFGVLVKGINSIWDKAIKSQEAFDIWFSVLQDIPYNIASMAVEKCASTLEFAPKPAHIRKFSAELTENASDYMTPQEAWGYIERAIGKSTYYAQEAYDKLPPILKKCTSPDQLHTLATDENYNSGVESSNFIRTYNELLRREKEFNQLTPSLQNLISSTGNTLGIEGD